MYYKYFLSNKECFFVSKKRYAVPFFLKNFIDYKIESQNLNSDFTHVDEILILFKTKPSNIRINQNINFYLLLIFNSNIGIFLSDLKSLLKNFLKIKLFAYYQVFLKELLWKIIFFTLFIISMIKIAFTRNQQKKMELMILFLNSHEFVNFDNDYIYFINKLYAH